MHTIGFVLNTYLTQQDCVSLPSAVRHASRTSSFIRFLAVSVVVLCCCALHTKAQTNVFGPETFTRNPGTPVPITKTFTVAKPEGSFDVVVESAAPINGRRPRINAIVRLNGREIAGPSDGNSPRILKSVSLKRDNDISVQVLGEPSASISIKISPSFKYVLYTNPKEPLVLTGERSDGTTIAYYGEKNAKGHAKTVTSMRVTTAKGESVDYFFNRDSRLSEIRSFNGLRLRFKWTSNTAADITMSDAEGANEVTTPIHFSKLGSQAGASGPFCPQCASNSARISGLRRNHADLSNAAFFPSNNPLVSFTNNAASVVAAAGVEEACLATAAALTKVCNALQVLQFGGITSGILCAALASAATLSVYGLPLVPLIFVGCEIVMIGAELGCFALELSNLYNKTEPICNRVSNFFTGIKNFVLGAGVLVAGSLQVSPGTYAVGQTIGGSFTIVNRGRTTVSLPRVVIGGRLGGVCPNGRCPDFTTRTNISLSPGRAYSYYGTFTIPTTGTYSFSVAYQKTDGSWVIPVPPEGIAVNQRIITVQQIAPKAVVSRSLTLSPTTATYRTGQAISGSFAITNRGTSNFFMKRVLIGGRLGGACPNNQCPDFTPVPSSITLAPGQSYNYTGSFTPTLAGNYTFSVAYENSDGKWTIPVEAENGNKNQLGVSVTGIQPNVVVSKSLTLSPGTGPFPLGQVVTGTFTIANRGNAPLTMRQVIIGGRLGGNCPNNVCPDFSPIAPNITLNPGQTYSYSGRIMLTQPGSYTFYVAYETPEGKWEMPVKPDAGAINQLSVVVQPPGPVLTKASPTSVAASANAQSINLYGLRLAKVIYAQVRLPNGSITYLYIPLNQVFRVNDGELRINAKFTMRGTNYITVWTADGKSNEFPIVVY